MPSPDRMRSAAGCLARRHARPRQRPENNSGERFSLGYLSYSAHCNDACPGFLLRLYSPGVAELAEYLDLSVGQARAVPGVAGPSPGGQRPTSHFLPVETLLCLAASFWLVTVTIDEGQENVTS